MSTKRRGLLRHLLTDPVACSAIVLLVAMAVAALVGPLLVGFDPLESDLRSRYSAPDAVHVLGTDGLGRDILARILLGMRVSLLVGVCAVALGFTVGVIAALLSGYFGGWVNAVISRVIEAQLSIPFLLLVLTIMALLGPSLVNVIVVLGLTSWLAYARVLTPEVSRIRNEPFVQASRTIGVPTPRILVRNVMPNIINVTIPIAALEVGAAIISASTLDFFGVGIPAPNPTLGGMITEGRGVISTAWWITVFPGLAIVVLVACCSLLADSAARYLNPKEREMLRRGPRRLVRMERRAHGTLA